MFLFVSSASSGLPVNNISISAGFARVWIGIDERSSILHPVSAHWTEFLRAEICTLIPRRAKVTVCGRRSRGSRREWREGRKRRVATIDDNSTDRHMAAVSQPKLMTSGTSIRKVVHVPAAIRILNCELLIVCHFFSHTEDRFLKNLRMRCSRC